MPECYRDKYHTHYKVLYKCRVYRLKRLADRVTEFHVLIDNETELKLLEQNPLTDKLWSVFVEVDCGYGRGLLCSLVVDYSGHITPCSVSMRPIAKMLHVAFSLWHITP